MSDPYDIDFGDDEEPVKPVPDVVPEPVVEEKPPQPPVKRGATLLVIRHGNTFEAGEAPRRIGGRTDLPLTAEGRSQIVRLRTHLIERGLLPELVFTGPLQRTAQSAALISKTYESVEFLREINHGMDENKPEEQVIRNIGTAALRAWDEENKLPRGWTADILGIREGWQGLKKLTKNAGEIRAAVTSNGIARFALENVENAPANKKLGTGAYGILVWNGTSWLCEGWNIRP